jgi:hypothetical protein
VADLEHEKRLIEDYDSNRVVVTELWALLREPKPLSINRVYSDGARRFLTKEGATFKDALRTAVARELAIHSVGWNQVFDAVYKYGGSIGLDIWIYFDDLMNRLWRVGGSMTEPKKSKATGKTAKPKLRAPYTQKDGSNYIKLIEDAVVLGTGLDDCVHLDVAVHKRDSPHDPRIVIRYQLFE